VCKKVFLRKVAVLLDGVALMKVMEGRISRKKENMRRI
jgi:hypothetical protein